LGVPSLGPPLLLTLFAIDVLHCVAFSAER